MEYLRMFLIMLRRRENTPSELRFSIQLLIASVVGIISGLVLDMILPFNFYTNTIRGVIAIITGVSIFSYGYLMANKFEEIKLVGNKYYKPMRKRFSFKQRANISILISTFSVLIILFTSKQDFIFTLKSTLAISIIIMAISFARRDRNEFIKDIYEIPDTRDLEFMSRRREKLKEKELENKNKK